MQVTYKLIIRGRKKGMRDVLCGFCHMWEDGIFLYLQKTPRGKNARERKVFEDMESLYLLSMFICEKIKLFPTSYQTMT